MTEKDRTYNNTPAMILAIPYVNGATDYDALAKDIRRRGKLLNHSLLTVSSPELESEAYEFTEGMSDIFLRSHTSVLMPAERRGNQLSTDLFKAAARFLRDYEHQEGELADPAMLYFDPSYRPTEVGWLDQIQSSYYLKRAPLVFGRFTRNEPRILSGPAVIRKDFYQKSGLLQFVPVESHYRTYMQHEFRQNAVETFLIGPGSQDSVLRQQKSKKPAA